MTDWQSIETAPKDARYVLAYFPQTNVITIAMEDGGYWHNESGGVIHDPKQYPRPAIRASHWMPLPKPPELRR